MSPKKSGEFVLCGIYTLVILSNVMFPRLHRATWIHPTYVMGGFLNKNGFEMIGTGSTGKLCYMLF